MSSHSSARLPGLDTLRSAAIVGVILYHVAYALPESFHPVVQFGWMGVDLFFVLSGFLIGSQLLRAYARNGGIDITGFYRRRAFRILPAYSVVLALYLTVPQWREFPGLAPWWKFVSFTANLLFDPEQRAFSHVWSLCVEEHFYLVLPFLVGWMMRRPSARRTVLLVLGLVLGGIVLRASAVALDLPFMARIYYPTYMRLDGLIAGVVLAIIRTFRPAWWERAGGYGHATLLSGASLVGAVMWMFRGDRMGDTTGSGAWGTVVGFPLLALGLAVIVASAVSRNGALSRWPIPGARPLALLAFSLYLSHKAVVHVVRLLLPTLTAARDLRAGLIYAASCVAAAALLYACVERPFLQLRERLDGHRTAQLTRQMQQEPAI